jgi:tRNA pseudouridine38-40 synthase
MRQKLTQRATVPLTRAPATASKPAARSLTASGPVSPGGPRPGAGTGQRGPREEAGPDAIRLRLEASYDGSGFHGWARQAGLRSVQQVIEEALGLVLGLPGAPGLTVAGRTDAGVHARGQVAHLDVPPGSWELAGDSAVRRLARLLPPDVRVPAISVAPDGFDARFSALWRRYSYRVCTGPAGAEPLRRHDTLWYPRALDLARMNDAARACLGEHDFAAFCRRRPGATTVRSLLRMEWQAAGPGTAVATVTADAFCHNMVRALVGAMLLVGDGARPVSWVAQVLAAGVRDSAVRVVPPHGLCLEEVGYPAAAELSARAAMTRRVRQQDPAPRRD